MSTREKLIKRFLLQPKDFTWDELVRLFGFYGFSLDNKGKSSGSRAQFIKDGDAHTVHKPHPSNIIKGYALKSVLKFLIERGLVDDKTQSDNTIKQDGNEQIGI